jgi:hypothetical protein
MTNTQAQTKKIKQAQPIRALRLKTRNGFLDKVTFLFFFIKQSLFAKSSSFNPEHNSFNYIEKLVEAGYLVRKV